MKFADYQSTFAGVKMVDRPKVLEVAKAMADGKSQHSLMVYLAMVMEFTWDRLSKPYYDVYPSIEERFVKLDLRKVKVSHLNFPEKVLLIRTEKNGCCLVSKRDNNKELVIVVNVDGGHFTSFIRVTGEDDAEVLDEFSKELERHPKSDLLKHHIKLACSCGLLSQEFLEEEVLSKDKTPAILNDPEKKQAAIERARRRGKIGWVVGKTQQTVPGIRVGHECLVWTGEGRKIPKIVWRRETVVHRKQVLETPTGYLE